MVTNFTFLTQHGSTCSCSHSIPRHGAVATMGASASGDAGRGEAWLGGGMAGWRRGRPGVLGGGGCIVVLAPEGFLEF